MKAVTLRPYQEPLYSEIVSKLDTKNVVVAALSTGAGKTVIATKLIQDVMSSKRVLVLTENQNNLLTNFYDTLIEYLDPKLVFSARSGRELVKHANSYQVVVALPGNIARSVESLDQFDLLIVDEADIIYGVGEKKKMYTKILEWHGDGEQLLLTASHYPLDLPKVFFSRQDALEIKAVSDVQYMQALVDCDLVESDFNKDQEVKQSSYSKQISPDIIRRVELERSQIDGPVMIQVPYDVDGRAMASSLGVPMTSCKSDPNSLLLDRFKAGEFDTLVVVSRGGRGYDYKDLAGFLDVSFTKNISRVEQSVGRVQRVASDGRTKIFIKFVPSAMQLEYDLIRSAVQTLSLPEYYETWNGAFRNAPVRVKLVADTKDGRIVTPTERVPKPRTISGTSCPVLMDVFGFNTRSYKDSTVVTMDEVIQHMKYGDSHVGCKTPEAMADWVKRNVNPTSSMDWIRKHKQSYGVTKQRKRGPQVASLLGLKRSRPPAKSEEERLEMKRERERKYREANREAINEQQRKRYTKLKEKDNE